MYCVQCRQKAAPAAAQWLELPRRFSSLQAALLAAYRARQRFHLLQFKVISVD